MFRVDPENGDPVGDHRPGRIHPPPAGTAGSAITALLAGPDEDASPPTGRPTRPRPRPRATVLCRGPQRAAEQQLVDITGQLAARDGDLGAARNATRELMAQLNHHN